MSTKDNVIKYSRTELSRCLDEVEAALRDKGALLWQMGGRLVEVVRLDRDAEATGQMQHKGTLVIRPVSDHRLLEIMLGCVQFTSYNERSKKWVASAPPLEFARHYAARGTWNLPVLRGIVEAPTLRPDCTILSKPGYDHASGIYLDTGGVEFPAVPAEPTRADALDALAKLKDVIRDFPFVPDADDPSGLYSASRSVALSAILTGVCRKGLRTAPGHGFDATTMATGKTLLCDTIAMIATGRTSSTISQGKSEEEFNKRLFSILLQGDPVITIDNIEQPVRSDEFCTVLTSEEWKSRVLGLSCVHTVTTNVLFLMNGNGLTFEGDISTRVLVCRMDAAAENPGARLFSRDLRKWVPQHRPELVAAALTVLRAFVFAGRPGLDKLNPFGRFEDWSNLVRGALVWLGESDPCITHRDVVAHDPQREVLSWLLRAWDEIFGAAPVTAKLLIETAKADTQTETADTDVSTKERLRDALDGLTPQWQSPRSLGRALSKFRGRIVDGKRITEISVAGRSKSYRLESVETE